MPMTAALLILAPLAAALLILAPLAAALLAWCLNRLAIIPWRRAAQQHWTERARRLYPIRLAAAHQLWLIPACLVLAQRLWLPDSRALWPVLAFLTWGGALLGTYPFECLLFPWLHFREWLHLTLAYWLLRLGFWVLFIGGIVYMPKHFGWAVVLIAGSLLALVLLLQFGLGLWLSRQLRLLLPPTERLQRIVDTVAGRMQVAYHRLWLLRYPAANAAAFPTTGDLVFSERLLRLLADEEIAAIAAHELGHLTESRLTTLGRLAGLLALFPWLLINPVLHRFESLGLLALAVVSLIPVAAVRRLARRMEVRADHLGHEHQAESGVYARALEKLYEANQLPAVMQDRRLPHPHLYDRLVAAGPPPLYPRPKPPAKLTWTGALLLVLFFCLVLASLWPSACEGCRAGLQDGRAAEGRP